MRPVEGIALSRVLDEALSDLICVLTPGVDLEGTVRTVVIADPDALERLPIGALVLAPGAPTHRGELALALERAHAAGAAAVAVRESVWTAACARRGGPPNAALPVLGVPDLVDWGVLYELIATLLATAGGIAPRVPSDRPMADLFAFADAVAASIGGAVTIEDAQAQVLAYSNLGTQPIDPERESVILRRRVPMTDSLRKRYTGLTRTTEPTRYPGTANELPRMAVAIRAGDQVLGFMFVIGDESTLSENASIELVDAARMAAVHLVRDRVAGDIVQRSQDEALARLLDGSRDAQLLAATGLARKRAVSVLAARYAPLASEEDPHDAAWLAGLVALAARAHDPGALCLMRGQTAYVVIGTSKAGVDLAPMAQRIVDRAAAHGRGLHVGLARNGSVEELGEMRRDADRALAAISAREGGGPIAGIDDVRHLAILHRLGELAQEHPELLAGPARALVEGDARAPAWGVDTLRAYVDCFGRLPEAAARLGIHPNTLRYRLRRLGELFAFHLDDPDERLVLGLQLRLLVPRSGDEPASHGELL